MPYAVRLAQPSDLPRLLSLMSELRPGADPSARYKWMYEGNPAGRATTFLAVEEGTGETAGMASIFPWRLRAAGRQVLAGLGGDDYVRPAHRRRGIAGSMHTACRMSLEGRGIGLICGTPTRANSTPLAVAGTRDITTVHRFVAPAKLLGLLRPRWLLGASSARVAVAEARPDRRIDGIWERVVACDKWRIAPVRDAQFFDWRFRRAPGGRQQSLVLTDAGKPFAACAIERRARRVRIVELLAADRDLGRALRAIYDATPFDALEMRATAKRASALRLWSYGFLSRESGPLNVMLPHGVESSRAALFHDASRWSFSWADTDVESTWREQAAPTHEAVPSQEQQNG